MSMTAQIIVDIEMQIGRLEADPQKRFFGDHKEEIRNLKQELKELKNGRRKTNCG